MFESDVNLEGIKTCQVIEETFSMFESDVNLEGIKTDGDLLITEAIV